LHLWELQCILVMLGKCRRFYFFIGLFDQSKKKQKETHPSQADIRHCKVCSYQPIHHRLLYHIKRIYNCQKNDIWVTLSYGHFVIVRNINILPVGTARSRINKSWLGSIWICNLGWNINIMRLILISLAFRVEKSAITWIITIFSAKLEFFANAVTIADRITFLKCFWFVVLNINIFPIFAPFFCIFPYRLNLI